jgi:hypothetical protein
MSITTWCNFYSVSIPEDASLQTASRSADEERPDLRGAAYNALTLLKPWLRQALSKSLWHRATMWVFRTLGRPPYKGETFKARPRRAREGFFAAYCRGRGIDIGYGGDLLCENCIGWDVEYGDAQTMDGVPDESFDFVYSSHLLEHVQSAPEALKNWYRLVKPLSYIIISVPDRDLYEKKTTLPSRWN